MTRAGGRSVRRFLQAAKTSRGGCWALDKAAKARGEDLGDGDLSGHCQSWQFMQIFDMQGEICYFPLYAARHNIETSNSVTLTLS